MSTFQISLFRSSDHARRNVQSLRRAAILASLVVVGLATNVTSQIAPASSLPARVAQCEFNLQKEIIGQDEVRSLDLNRPVQSEISGQQQHLYRVFVKAGQYLHVIVDQRGIDVSVALIDVDGRTIVCVDNPDLSTGSERVSLIASTSGWYRLGVSPFKKAAAVGRYEIKIAELRDSRKGDEIRVTAERLFAEAEALRLLWTAESFHAALAKYQESLVHWRALNDLRAEGATLNLIGMVFSLLGERQKQLEYLKLALPARHTAGDISGEAQTLNNLGVCYSSLGERQRALEYFQEALTLQQKVGDRTLEAFLYSNIGWSYLNQGQIQVALEYFSKSRMLNRAVGDPRSEAYTLSTLGAAYISLGEYHKALEKYNEALPLWRMLGIHREEASTLNTIASIYINSGQHEKALEYLDLAVPVLNVVADKSVKADTISGIAWIYSNLGQYQQALDTYKTVLSIDREIGERAGEGYTLASIGILYYRMGQSQQAIDHYNQALVIIREIKDRASEGNVLSLLMYASEGLGRPNLAIFYGKQAINAFQEIRANIRGLEKSLQKSFMKVREDPYRELAGLLINEGRLTEAQLVLGLLKEEEYFEYVRRSNEMASSLNGRATLNSTEAEVERKYLEIADRVTALGRERGELLGKEALTPRDEERLKTLESSLELANRAFQKFLGQLTDEFAIAKKGNEKIFELRESQGLMQDLRELGAGSVVLYTIVGDEKYRVILITPEAQVAREYPISAKELFKKVLAFREVLQDPTQDPKPIAEEMYKILIAPVAKDLRDANAQTLMWSLDGVLRYVPIAALHDGENYLVESYRNVVYTPASQARLKDTPSPKWKGLGLGVSKAQTGFKPLPAVPTELRAIIDDSSADSRLTGMIPGNVMLDDAFTADTMKKALRLKYTLVHIASHFQILPGNETSSFLLLGDGSHLTLAQINSSVNLFGGVEMLTLSACDTATGGTNEDGKEIEGFAVLAQRQGAKAVLATLWAVADESTRLLMQKFYRLREERPGTLKAEALRQAQLGLLRGEIDPVAPGKQQERAMAFDENYLKNAAARRFGVSDRTASYAHPYFWAPFILIGNWK